VVSGSDDKNLNLYNMDMHTPIYQFLDAHEGNLEIVSPIFKSFMKDPISCVTFSPDGKSIISGAGDNSIKVFDMESKKEAYHFVEVQEGKFLGFVQE